MAADLPKKSKKQTGELPGRRYTVVFDVNNATGITAFESEMMHYLKLNREQFEQYVPSSIEDGKKIYQGGFYAHQEMERQWQIASRSLGQVQEIVEKNGGIWQELDQSLLYRM